MGYLRRVHDTPEQARQEIQAVLRSNDIGQQTLAMQMGESNPQAIEDLRTYISLCSRSGRQVVVYDLIEKRYAVRPYGWPAEEVLLMLARLLVLGDISLMMDGALLPVERAYAELTTPGKQRKLIVIQRQTADPKALQQARTLGQQVFSTMGPDGEDALYTFLRTRLEACRSRLSTYKTLADTGQYPGQAAINDSLTLIKALLACDASYTFIERFNARQDDLLDFSDSYHDLEHFYEHQKPTWDTLLTAYATYTLNRSQLELDPRAAPALRRMHDILAAPSPYGLIHEAVGLITTVEGVNAALLVQHRTAACQKIDDVMATLTRDIAAAQGDDALRSVCLGPLVKLCAQVKGEASIAHVVQAEQQALALLDTAQGHLQAFVRKAAEQPVSAHPSPAPVPPKPVVKKVHPLRPVALVKTTYLETQQDADEFLDTLKRELDQALARGERIHIR
jgi:hypothetical protein